MTTGTIMDDGTVRVEFTETEYFDHEAKALVIKQYKQDILGFKPEIEDEIVGYFCELAFVELLTRHGKYRFHASLGHITGPDVLVRPKASSQERPTNSRGQWEVDVKGRRGASSDCTAPRSRWDTAPPTIYAWASMQLPYPPRVGIAGWNEGASPPSSWGTEFSSCVVTLHGWNWGRDRTLETVSGYERWTFSAVNALADLLDQLKDYDGDAWMDAGP